MLVASSVLVVGALVALYRWCTRPRGACPAEYPGAVPLLGHLYEFVRFIGNSEEFWNVIKRLNRFCYDNDGVCTLYIGLHKVYVLTDPDDSLTISNLCYDKPYIYKFAADFVGNGLVTADVHTWKQHRKLLNPRFNLQVLNSFMGVFNEQSRQLVSALTAKLGHGPFDIQPLVIDTSLKIVNYTTIGLLPGHKTKVDETYARATDGVLYTLLQRVQMFWMHIPFIYDMSTLKQTYLKHVKIITDLSKSAIEERKKANNIIHDDITSEKCRPLLDYLIEKEREGLLTQTDIREHLDTFIVAGYDTTATAITTALVLLGSYQDVQEKVYEEVKNVVVGADVTKHHLPQLVYTEAVVKECMRLETVLPIIGRKIERDIQLKSCTLRKGSSCGISLYGINRNPGIWGEDADEFRPERWLQPETLPKHPAAFASFSMGRRNCIGRQYSLISIKTTLAHILRKYQVYSDISQVAMKFEGLLKPGSGHEITIKERNPIPSIPV